MRIATTAIDGTPRAAIITGDSARVLEAGVSSLELLAMSAEDRSRAVEAASAVQPLESLSLLPPLVPNSIRDFMTFEQHLAGAIRWVNPGGRIAAEWYEAPCFYFTNALAATGPSDDVAFPPACEVLDFELELAAVLKSGGRDLTIEEAEQCIGGYMILNDWSARDTQTREMRIGLGPVKGKDFATTLGPWIVTPDELDAYVVDGQLSLQMTVSINGTEVGRDTSGNMAWTFAEMIAYASRGATVAAGDVFGSGTCGTGCLAELWGWAGEQNPPPLQPGDVITMAVQGIGTIENRLVSGTDAIPIPAARRRAGIRLD